MESAEAGSKADPAEPTGSARDGLEPSRLSPRNSRFRRRSDQEWGDQGSDRARTRLSRFYGVWMVEQARPDLAGVDQFRFFLSRKSRMAFSISCGYVTLAGCYCK